MLVTLCFSSFVSDTAVTAIMIPIVIAYCQKARMPLKQVRPGLPAFRRTKGMPSGRLRACTQWAVLASTQQQLPWRRAVVPPPSVRRCPTPTHAPTPATANPALPACVQFMSILGYAALTGGTNTVIGTSTNLVISGASAPLPASGAIALARSAQGVQSPLLQQLCRCISSYLA